MIKLCDNTFVRTFDYIYFFIMVIYMAQMSVETARMVAGLSSPWFPFLLPLILTIILCFRHKVSFKNKYLWILMLICLVWNIAVTIKKELYTPSDQSFQFFLFYSIVIAYIHIQVFGSNLLILYETIIVKLCKISFVLWILTLLMPSVLQSIGANFPETQMGHNIFYIYNMVSNHLENYYRNAGCSWEPGRFAIMIILGIYCNILRLGVTIKHNRNLFWLLLTLISTFSTTGYSTVIIMFLISQLHRLSFNRKIVYIIIIIPVVYYIYGLDFMGQKIKTQTREGVIAEKLSSIEYNSMISEKGEYVGSLGRFEAIYFEWFNIINDPLLGYGRNNMHSYFSQTISSNYTLTGGLLSIVGQHGVILSLIFYTILLKSSKRFYFSNRKHGNPFLLFVVILLSSISYVIFTIPVFTAFWFYSLFELKTKNNLIKV